jgi:UDP-N-acetylmuramoyl-tripeptide--D-alanyl-D-alanine ligase
MGVSRLVTLGKLAVEIAKGAKAAGMPTGSCHDAASHGEIVAWLRENSPEGAWILVKGSRGMTMERVVEGILSE